MTFSSESLQHELKGAAFQIVIFDRVGESVRHSRSVDMITLFTMIRLLPWPNLFIKSNLSGSWANPDCQLDDF